MSNSNAAEYWSQLQNFHHLRNPAKITSDINKAIRSRGFYLETGESGRSGNSAQDAIVREIAVAEIFHLYIDLQEIEET